MSSANSFVSVGRTDISSMADSTAPILPSSNVGQAVPTAGDVQAHGTSNHPSQANQSRSRQKYYPMSNIVNSTDVKTGANSGKLPLIFQPELDPEKIMEFAKRYKSFEYRNYEFKDLPKYDDLTGFGVPEVQEHRLWKLEIDRLVAAVKNPGAPILFAPCGLGKADAKGFANVTNLCDQIACNVSIIHHDNCLVDRSDKVHREKKRWYSFAKHRIQTRYTEATNCPDDDNVRGKRPELLAQGNREAYFSMVDYLTAILARYLYKCASSQFWHNQCFSTLAKWSAKLKVIEKDPVEFARLSLEAGEDLDDELEQTSYLEFLDSGPPRFNPNKYLNGGAEEPYDPSNVYHTVERQFRDILGYNLYHLVEDAFRPIHHKQRPEAMEVCTRVYRTGQQSSHTIIANDREGQFSAATDSKQLRYSRAAFEILLKNAKTLQKVAQDRDSKTTPEKTKNSEDTAIFEWQWQVADGTDQSPSGLGHKVEDRFETTSIEDAVSIFLPHSLCDAHISSETMGLIMVTRIASQLLEDETVEEYVDEDFAAEFICMTGAYQKIAARMAVGRDSSSLKDATMFRDHILPGTHISKPSGALDVTNKLSWWKKPFKRGQKPLAIFNTRMEKTHSWKIDEKAVIVPCWRYVGTCLTIAVLIIAGGLAIPFSSSVRLPGVDPFNISNFSWLLAAFFLFLAQSRHVPDWKWHDFLHGRVVCRTISELASASGLPHQLVLHRLLMAEKSSSLSTRGPYNSFFSRRSDDGFSIDVACMTSTLYASGFVLIQGIGKFERHVVCLDARPVSILLQAVHREHSKTSLGCPLPLDAQPNGSKLPVLKMTEDEFMTERVIGLYVGDRMFG